MKGTVLELPRLRRSMGLIESSPLIAAQSYQDWMNGILNRAGARMEARPVAGDVNHAMESLLPIVDPPLRSLFVPCRAGWTALFENSQFGTDQSRLSMLAKLTGMTTMRVVAVPDGQPSGDYGAVIWQVFAPGGDPLRSIYAMNDGGRWEFWQSGEPYPFEDLQAYTRRPIRRRLTIDMLIGYLEHLDLHPFDDNWFLSEGAVLVERFGGYKVPSVEISDTVH